MLKKHVVAGVMATVCCVAPALAQTSPGSVNAASSGAAPQPADAGLGSFITQPHQYVRASRLVGVEVIGADVTRIGETEELLVDTNGRIAGVVIGVGGFLGMGEKRVAIPFDKILWNYGEVARETAPSASVAAPPAPGAAPPASANAEKMPGANVSTQVLDAPDRNQSAAVNPATGPVTAGTAGQATATATTPAVSPGRNPVRAVLLLSRADLEKAPALDDRRDRPNAAGSPTPGSPGTSPRP